MGKKKDSRSKFAAAIDPRFTGIFKDPSKENDISRNGSISQEKQASDNDKGFRDFLSKKLFEYLESNIKEVEVPQEKDDFIQFEIDDVRLLPGFPVLSEDQLITSVETAPPKKKRKKEKRDEKDLFKQVAVTADFIKQQAKIFNS
ncbi:uncharacterized protein LOC129977868 [Argiope bruennichi]|uniref:Uncharacterized protein n=1 Tax=Argiope bruennichi TaxID=94029 RepID=A0A8T0E057_ARGBR|nr:uncharacterized protein LOC129977868 [Argiope bruennichi]KAF8763331.1 hypothetical protein HNY73_021526 [Argiope bruennichi]